VSARSLDLGRHRTLGELLGTTFALFGRYTTVFTGVTALVVVPYVVLVDGIWGHRLAHGALAHASAAQQVASFLLGVFVVPAMVTALHAVIVRGLGRGEQPTVGAAMATAAERLWPAIGAVVLYTLVVALGLVLLVLPGIWLGVRCYFAAQAAVIDGEPPRSALGRSADLVQGRWWRTFGVLIVAGVVFSLVTLPLTIPIAFVHQGVAYTGLRAVEETIARSLTALFGTLLFFDLRARREPQPTFGWLPPVDPSQA
jgi:hypothetical protein